jgi:hypothetical protein
LADANGFVLSGLLMNFIDFNVTVPLQCVAPTISLENEPILLETTVSPEFELQLMSLDVILHYILDSSNQKKNPFR